MIWADCRRLSGFALHAALLAPPLPGPPALRIRLTRRRSFNNSGENNVTVSCARSAREEEIASVAAVKLIKWLARQQQNLIAGPSRWTPANML